MPTKRYFKIGNKIVLYDILQTKTLQVATFYYYSILNVDCEQKKNDKKYLGLYLLKHNFKSYYIASKF